MYTNYDDEYCPVSTLPKDLVASNFHSHVGGHHCMELFVLEGSLGDISTFVGKTRATKDTLTIDYSVLPVDYFGPLADVS